MSLPRLVCSGLSPRVGLLLILGMLFLQSSSGQPTLAWVRHLPSPEAQRALTLDGAGNAYVICSFEGSAQISDTEVYRSAPNFQRDYLIAKFSPEGVLLWIHAVSGPGGDDAISLRNDSSGRTYVVARTTSFQYPDRLDLGAGVTVDDAVSYLLCLSGEGKTLWATELNGRAIGDLAVTPQGSCFLTTGAYSTDTRGPVALQRFDSNGKLVWERRFGGSLNDSVAGLAIDPNNDVSVSGIVYLPANFEGEVFTSPGEPWQGYVARYSSDGRLLWVRSGTNVISGSVGVDRDSNCYVAGSSRSGNQGVQSYDKNGGSRWKMLETFPQSNRVFTDSEGNSITSSDYGVPVFRKYTSAGVLQWKFTEPSGIVALVSGIAQSGSGSLYVIARGLSRSVNYLAGFSRDNEAPITLSNEGEGSIVRVPEAQFYPRGTSVSLTAVAASWFSFQKWADGITELSRRVTVGDSNFYKAIFYPTTAVETLVFTNGRRVAPIGMPYVQVDGVFRSGTVTVHAPLAEVSIRSSLTNGVIFYTLDGSRPSYFSRLYDGPFILKESKVVQAVTYDGLLSQAWPCDPVPVVFEKGYEISSLVRGGGQIQEVPTGPWHPRSSRVALNALPAAGWTFLQWRGSLNGSKAEETITLTQNLCLEAVFGTEVRVPGGKGGQVTIVPLLTNYPYGTPVQLSARADPGYAFASWGNSFVSSENPVTFGVTNTTPTISAVFVPLADEEVALNMSVLGYGRVTVKPPGNRYRRGQSVELLSTPDIGQTFVGWSEDVVSPQPRVLIRLDGSRSVTAHFSRSPLLSVAPCFDASGAEPLRLWLQGEVGIGYRIEQSTFGRDWVPTLNLTNRLVTSEIVLPAPRGWEPVFYRAVRLPAD